MKDHNNFFRMSFIVQDNAAMTLETNLVKIIEAVLFDAKGERLSSNQISIKIKEDVGLDFSESEVRQAILKRGKNIQNVDNKFFLNPQYREKLNKQEDFKSQIEKYTHKAIEELGLEVDESRLTQLLTEYLYYCFNSNKDSILALINNADIKVNNFIKDEEDIKLINAFLSWKNDEKDKFIYNVVSYGYIYCTLTVKKDELLANRLFRGKKFILDANIIFRLAGINNDSRMNTIKSFVEKCKEVGVSLCYTTATLEEIKRVIVNKVKWIVSVTGEQKPLDLREYDYSENDFYSMYCKWAADDTNRYDDYTAFQKYLIKLVMDVMAQLESIECSNYALTRMGEFNSLVASLQAYKEAHGNKKQTKASLITDINNIMRIRGLRKADKNENIWTTNVFFISADQNLVRWSADVEMGVPLVVLPSVWLTIMLRFSGRTTNDYKAFCSFLELRTHQPEAAINVYQLLQNLSEKTDSNEIKQLVVKEVFEHKDMYEEYVDESYEKVVTKAFDSIMSNKEKEELMNIEKWKDKYDAKEKELQGYEIQKVVDEEFQIRALVNNDCKKHLRFIKWLNRMKMPIAFIMFCAMVLLTVLALFKVGVLYSFLMILSPETVNGMGNTLSALGIVWAIVVAGAGFVGGFLHYLCSEKRDEKYRQKREAFYKELFKK